MLALKLKRKASVLSLNVNALRAISITPKELLYDDVREQTSVEIRQSRIYNAQRLFPVQSPVEFVTTVSGEEIIIKCIVAENSDVRFPITNARLQYHFTEFY